MQIRKLIGNLHAARYWLAAVLFLLVTFLGLVNQDRNLVSAATVQTPACPAVNGQTPKYDEETRSCVADTVDGSCPTGYTGNSTDFNCNHYFVRSNLCPKPADSKVTRPTVDSGDCQYSSDSGNCSSPYTAPSDFRAGLGNGCVAWPCSAEAVTAGCEDVDTANASALDGSGNPVDGSKGSEAVKLDNCPIATDTSLRWLLCPVVELVNKMVEQLDAFIDAYLQTNNEVFSPPSTQAETASQTNGTGSVTAGVRANVNGYHTAWGVFRNFGIGLVVIAGIIMVAAEALSIEFVDAYTVRRVLPRLFIAVIGIAISWDLMHFLVGFFDNIGHFAGAIIYSSFGLKPSQVTFGAIVTPLLDSIGGVIPSGVAEAGAAAAAAAAAVFAAKKYIRLGPAGILSMIGTLVLVMFVGAAVLIARQAIIIATVVIAPLAIASFILPNTNKMASFWWTTFFSMMILYPIATGLIAICKVMAQITLGVNQFGANIVAIIFFIIGYVLLPFAFRLSGGLVATIGGLANDRSKGAFDRLKNFRAKTAETRSEKAKKGQLYSDRNFATRGLDRLGVSTGNGFWGAMPGERGRQTRNTARANGVADTMKSNAAFQAHMNDPDTMEQLAKYKSAGEARKAAGRARTAALSSASTSAERIEAEAKYTRTKEAIGRAETIGYANTNRQAAFAQNAKSGYGFSSHADLRRTAASIAGGNNSRYNTMMNDAEYDSKGAGAWHLTRADTAKAEHDQMWQRWNAADPYSHSKGKEKSMEAFAEHFEKELTAVDSSGNVDHTRRERALQFFEEAKGIKNNSGSPSEVINAALDRTVALRDQAMRSLDATPFGTGGINAVPVRDPNGPLAVNPETGNFERPVSHMRQESAAERIRRQARSSQPPDPNRV